MAALATHALAVTAHHLPTPALVETGLQDLPAHQLVGILTTVCVPHLPHTKLTAGLHALLVLDFALEVVQQDVLVV